MEEKKRTLMLTHSSVVYFAVDVEQIRAFAFCWLYSVTC